MATLLNVNNYHYRRGGADVVYLEQSELFRDLGWTVAEMAMRHPDNLPSDWERFFYGELYRAGLRPIPQYDVERYYRDAKITEIYEGTKEIQKNTIASSVMGKLK